jgi:hypothetical protein
MPSVARAAYIPLRALAANVIAVYSRSRRKLRKPDSITTIEPFANRLYSLDELMELRRTMLLRSFFSAGKPAQPTPADSCLAA